MHQQQQKLVIAICTALLHGNANVSFVC